jgi:hypothetical protein
MSRREPLISTRSDDLPVFPTEPPPAVPSTRTILRRFAAALTCRVAGRRRYELMARFHPLTPDLTSVSESSSTHHYSRLRAYLQKGAGACRV